MLLFFHAALFAADGCPELVLSWTFDPSFLRTEVQVDCLGGNY
jgi:hypothetical protein